VTNHDKENKSVRFPTSLARVRRFDKLQCPQSVSGFTPMSIRSLNFTNNDHLLDYLSVGLEKIEKDENNIVGTVRVKNYGFQKKIAARYSFDNWQSFHLTYAEYVCSLTLAGNQDQFEFAIEIPPSMRVSTEEQHHCLKFAVQYLVNGQEYWDNNQGKNYAIEIIPAMNISPMEANLYIPPSPESTILSSKPSLSHSSFGSRYNFSTNFAASNNFASTSNLSTSVSTGYLPPHRPVRNVRLTQPSQGELAAPVMDTTLGSQPISIPFSNSTYAPSPSGFSCSPISGFGWAKAQTSWFDSITLDDFSNHSPPVHSS